MGLTIRNTVIGVNPLICAPIVSHDLDGIIEEAEMIVKKPVDIIEWRVDFFEYNRDYDSITDVLSKIRKICGDLLIIFTYRTKSEGGEENISGDDLISRDEYVNMLKHISKHGSADIIDVQTNYPECAKELISFIKACRKYCIASRHFFDKTPNYSEMKDIMLAMDRCGADILKLAVMPQSTSDVMTLLNFTYNASNIFKKPVVTMSMGKLGAVSRISGSLTGSAITFASVKKSSAPGQIPVEKMEEFLKILQIDKPQNRNIFLIGFMGCGKSTVSKILSSKLNMEEQDSDAYIENQEKMTIADIFAEKGEEYFRDLETKFLKSLHPQQGVIIACGGGMALREENALLMSQKGTVIMLTAGPETIFERVRYSNNRPLLNNNMNVDYIRDMMDKRIPFYEAASSHIIKTDNKKPAEIADEIICFLQK